MLKIKIEENNNIITSNRIILFEQPSKIYISLQQNGKQFLPLVKKGDYVYQEEKISFRKNDHFPLFSSISGIVENVDINGITIQNDYQNRKRNQVIEEYDFLHYNKQLIAQTLFETGIQNIGMSGEEPYHIFSEKRIFKTFIINALQQEPYVFLEWFQLKIERKQLLEIIELLVEIYNFEEVLIVIPNQQKLLLEEWRACIWDTRIKLIEKEEYYSLSHTRELIKDVKGITYQSYPSEKGIVVLNVSTLYSIYQALKYRRPCIRMLLQFTGNMWKKNCYIEARIGSYLKEVLGELEFKRAKEILLLRGCLMNGCSISPEEESVYFNHNIYSAWKNKKEKISENCIRCGKCIEVCPRNLNPVLVMDAVSKKKNIKRFHVERCIECGICSHICPMYIDVKKFLLKAKGNLQ